MSWKNYIYYVPVTLLIDSIVLSINWDTTDEDICKLMSVVENEPDSENLKEKIFKQLTFLQMNAARFNLDALRDKPSNPRYVLREADLQKIIHQGGHTAVKFIQENYEQLLGLLPDPFLFPSRVLHAYAGAREKYGPEVAQMIGRLFNVQNQTHNLGAFAEFLETEQICDYLKKSMSSLKTNEIERLLSYLSDKDQESLIPNLKQIPGYYQNFDCSMMPEYHHSAMFITDEVLTQLLIKCDADTFCKFLAANERSVSSNVYSKLFLQLMDDKTDKASEMMKIIIDNSLVDDYVLYFSMPDDKSKERLFQMLLPNDDLVAKETTMIPFIIEQSNFKKANFFFMQGAEIEDIDDFKTLVEEYYNKAWERRTDFEKSTIIQRIITSSLQHPDQFSYLLEQPNIEPNQTVITAIKLKIATDDSDNISKETTPLIRELPVGSHTGRNNVKR